MHNEAPARTARKASCGLGRMRSSTGLCAETVVEVLEDVEDYRGFEAAIIADYDANHRRRAGAGLAVSLPVVAIAPGDRNRDRSAADPGRDLAGAQIDWPSRPMRCCLEVRPIEFWPRRPTLTANSSTAIPGRPSHRLPARAHPEFPAARQPRQCDIRAARTLRSGSRTADSEDDFLAEVGAGWPMSNKACGASSRLPARPVHRRELHLLNKFETDQSRSKKAVRLDSIASGYGPKGPGRREREAEEASGRADARRPP